MLTSLTTTYKNRVAHAKTYLFNTNRITDFFENGKYATGSVTITSHANLVAGADDTIELAGVTFTAQIGAATPGNPTFQSAVTNTAAATSLAAQINAYDEAGALGVNRITAVANGEEVILTADVIGTAANAYTLVYTDVAGTDIGATVSGAGTLSGGVASTCALWYNERKDDRRDKSDEYRVSETYPELKAVVDSSDIKNARIELTTTEKNNEAFTKTLDVNLDDIIKVSYFDATQSYVYLARGAFKVDKYLATYTRVEILALQNAIYKRGVAGTDIVATEHGDADYHKTILTLSDVTLTVAVIASEAIGALTYTMPEGYIYPTHFIVDLSISSDTQTDAPVMGIGTKVGTGAVAVLTGDAEFESIYTAIAIGALTPAGTAVALREEVEADYYPVQGVAPYDGSTTAMPIYLNFADPWAAAGDFIVNGTITLWYRWVGDD